MKPTSIIYSILAWDFFIIIYYIYRYLNMSVFEQSPNTEHSWKPLGFQYVGNSGKAWFSNHAWKSLISNMSIIHAPHEFRSWSIKLCFIDMSIYWLIFYHFCDWINLENYLNNNITSQRYGKKQHKKGCKRD